MESGLIQIVKQAAPGGRRLRGPRRPAARAKDIGERRRDRVADLRDIGAAFRRRDVQVPAHGARHRAANGLRAGHIHRHSRLPEPRQAGLVLRAGAAQPAVRHVDIVGVGVAAGQQEAEEPAHILLQLPCAQPQPMGRLLRALPRQGDAARQGAESRGEEAAQGDLRDHEGQGSVRSLTAGGDRRPGRACVNIAKKRPSKGRIPLDRTIGTPQAVKPDSRPSTCTAQSRVRNNRYPPPQTQPSTLRRHRSSPFI